MTNILFGQPGLSVEIQVSQDGLLVASEGEHGQRHLRDQQMTILIASMNPESAGNSILL